MRLAKYLAHAGVASRRASEQLVFDGRVVVDGAVVTDPARDVDGTMTVVVDGTRVKVQAASQRAVYAVHTPAGVVSTAADPQGRPTIVELVTSGRRLYPVGRLDVDTTGLILLTDDGDLAHHLTHPSFGVPRTYVAKVRNGPVREGALRALREGVRLEDGLTAPARVKRLGSDEVELTIHEGRKRQVRRMLEEVGHPVTSLQRISFGTLQLGTLKEGAARRLTEAEVDKLRRAATGAATVTAMRGALRQGGPAKRPSRRSR